MPLVLGRSKRWQRWLVPNHERAENAFWSTKHSSFLIFPELESIVWRQHFFIQLNPFLMPNFVNGIFSLKLSNSLSSLLLLNNMFLVHGSKVYFWPTSWFLQSFPYEQLWQYFWWPNFESLTVDTWIHCVNMNKQSMFLTEDVWRHRTLEKVFDRVAGKVDQ